MFIYYLFIFFYFIETDLKKGYRVIRLYNENDLLNIILEYVEGF